MSKKRLVWPKRDIRNVIEPTTLNIPAMFAECNQCGKMRYQNIVRGLCDKCAMKYARKAKEMTLG